MLLLQSAACWLACDMRANGGEIGDERLSKLPNAERGTYDIANFVHVILTLQMFTKSFEPEPL